jgi:rhodanese-related sulfurtransferase
MAGQLINFASERSNPDIPDVKDIDPKELWDKRSEVVIIDVRRPDEFTGDLGHIPGAQLMVLDTLPQRISELPDNKTLVFVCGSGGRSARATAFAQENGLASTFNLKGGMRLWNQLGLEVEGKS